MYTIQNRTDSDLEPMKEENIGKIKELLMTSLQEKLQQALYIERYAQGHSRECPCAIPELRKNIFTKCSCGQTQKDSLKRQEIRLTEEAMEKINEG